MRREEENPHVSEGRNSLHDTHETGGSHELEVPTPVRPGAPTDNHPDTPPTRHSEAGPSAKRMGLSLKNTYYVAGLASLILSFLGVDDIAAEHFLNLVDSFLSK
ncbi:hypothetical protein [Streptomyces sp. NPDC055681]